MSYQFAATDSPVRKVKRVEFGVFSPEEIIKQSVVKVEHEVLYENKEPKVGSLSDVRMGCIDKNMQCYTCKETINNCPGHFGHIELNVPVYHIQFIKYVKKILECVCHRCVRYRLLPTDHRYKKLLYVKEKFKYAYDQVKNKYVCDYPDCDHKMHPIRRSGIFLYYDEKRADKKTNRIPLSAAEAHEIVSRISDDTCRLIGLDPVNARPEWMIITILPVPPPCVRPSISVDTNGRSEDDLTHMLTNIIKYNNLVKKHENSRSGADFREQLQIHVASYFDNDIAGLDQITQKGGRPIKSLSARMKGKDGLIRGHLMGKRVDFSARTVITGDPNISIEEVGIPYSVAKNLTFPEIVTQHNIEKLQGLVDNSPLYPGAKFVIRDSGKAMWDLQFSVKKPRIKIGDKVERHLRDGDVILFNRQPTLHKMSMMAHRIRVMSHLTFRMNVNICQSYNADFDGDECNLHVPQSYETQAELLVLSRVSQLLISSQANKPVNALVQDALCGIRQLTLRDTFLSKEQFYNLVLWLRFSRRNGWKQNADLRGAEDLTSRREFPWDTSDIPTPAIFKPKPLWTGKQLLSMMLPRINLSGYHSVHQNRLDQFKKQTGTEQTEKWINENPEDTRVLIEDGELLSGIICKRTAGSTAGSIVHIVWQDYGPEAARDFMDNASQIVVQWMLMVGFTVGLGDALVETQVTTKIRDLVDEQYKKADMVINMYKTGNLLSQGNMTGQETKENKLQDILAKARDSAGSIANSSLDKGNNIKQMVEAGSKGSVLNICQISACVGQQIVNGKRIPYGFYQRTLPHYSHLEDSPESRGFVKNAFINGLKPQEVFFHAMGGREGLIDTAVKSVTWDTTIVIIESGMPKYVRIGEWIDAHLERAKTSVKFYPEDRNLELLDLSHPVYIPTCDSVGNVTWGALTAVTRHDPGDVLYKVTTAGGRKVTVTVSKSLLIWNPQVEKFVERAMSEVSVGDCVPVNARLPTPPVVITHVDICEYFPKTKFVHGTDYNLAMELMAAAQALPYESKAKLQRAKVRSLAIKNGLIHPYHASRKQAQMSDRFELNRDNGCFIGLFLAKGDADALAGSVRISNNDPTVRQFVKDWFTSNGITWEETCKISLTGTSRGVRGFSTLLALFLDQFVGHGAKNKFVPDVAFCATEEFIVGLLDGYMSGDGCVHKSSITSSSVSYRLSEGITMLCSRIGIFARIFTLRAHARFVLERTGHLVSNKRRIMSARLTLRLVIPSL